MGRLHARFLGGACEGCFALTLTGNQQANEMIAEPACGPGHESGSEGRIARHEQFLSAQSAQSGYEWSSRKVTTLLN